MLLTKKQRVDVAVNVDKTERRAVVNDTDDTDTERQAAFYELEQNAWTDEGEKRLYEEYVSNPFVRQACDKREREFMLSILPGVHPNGYVKWNDDTKSSFALNGLNLAKITSLVLVRMGLGLGYLDVRKIIVTMVMNIWSEREYWCSLEDDLS